MSLSYKTSVKLKEAEFPQENMEYYFEGNTDYPRSVENDYFNNGYGEDIYCACPTLDELIEECENQLSSICNTGNGPDKTWTVYGFSNKTKHQIFIEGPTLSEAVANLWLILNKK